MWRSRTHIQELPASIRRRQRRGHWSRRCRCNRPRCRSSRGRVDYNPINSTGEVIRLLIKIAFGSFSSVPFLAPKFPCFPRTNPTTPCVCLFSFLQRQHARTRLRSSKCGTTKVFFHELPIPTNCIPFNFETHRPVTGKRVVSTSFWANCTSHRRGRLDAKAEEERIRLGENVVVEGDDRRL